MKTIHTLTTLSIVSFLLASCTVSNTPYVYDDFYYNPSTETVQQARVDPNFSNQTNSQTGNYNDRYNQENKTNPNATQYQSNYAEKGTQQVDPSNQQLEDVEYYDADYAQTLQTINAPVRSFNTYDPYQRDRIMYTQNPVFMAPSVNGGFQFWDPFMPTTGLSIGWNSFDGWNVGVNAGFGFGCGRALNPYARFYDPFWGNNFGFYDPFWGPQFGWGNNFGWNNPWAWNNNFNNFAYQNGYRNGFNEGAFNNYRNYAVGNKGTGGRRQIVAPRGNVGSRNVSTGSGTRPSRPVRGAQPDAARTNTTTAPRSNEVRPTHPTPSNRNAPAVESRPIQSRPNTTTRPARSTPERYQLKPNRPQQTRPQQTNPTQSRPTTQPARPATRPIQSTPTRPMYNRPAQQSRPNYTRSATRFAPQQTRPAARPQTRQQSRPSYNKSRPTYSAPRSTGGSSRGSSTPSKGETRPSRK
tara:strand:+ start:76247 stop:77647 length:1401 start_codon:yes stop_codon:yes gene_type:complete